MTLRAVITDENSSGRCSLRPEPNKAACLDAETMTTLGAARAYNSTTTTGAHAHKEAVGALTAHNRRLVGAFHGDIP
jgi:hypothetical protein